MTTRMRPVVWMGLGLLVGTLGTSAWLQAQGHDARRDAVEEALREASRVQSGKVYSGGDIAFRAAGTRGTTLLVVPVVRVNGEWVEVEFGGGGIRKLTQ